MKIHHLIAGLVVATVGFVLFFILLASVSALAESKQIGAIGTLAAGRAGGARRVLFFVAVAAMLGGSCGVFGGVAKVASPARSHKRALYFSKS